MSGWMGRDMLVSASLDELVHTDCGTLRTWRAGVELQAEFRTREEAFAYIYAATELKNGDPTAATDAVRRLLEEHSGGG